MSKEIDVQYEGILHFNDRTILKKKLVVKWVNGEIVSVQVVPDETDQEKLTVKMNNDMENITVPYRVAEDTLPPRKS